MCVCVLFTGGVLPYLIQESKDQRCPRIYRFSQIRSTGLDFTVFIKTTCGFNVVVHWGHYGVAADSDRSAATKLHCRKL